LLIFDRINVTIVRAVWHYRSAL